MDKKCMMCLICRMLRNLSYIVSMNFQKYNSHQHMMYMLMLYRSMFDNFHCILCKFHRCFVNSLMHIESNFMTIDACISLADHVILHSNRWYLCNGCILPFIINMHRLLRYKIHPCMSYNNCSLFHNMSCNFHDIVCTCKLDNMIMSNRQHILSIDFHEVLNI